MPQEMLTTKEVARYLGIHEKQVYTLDQGESNPGDADHGKMDFPPKARR